MLFHNPHFDFSLLNPPPSAEHVQDVQFWNQNRVWCLCCPCALWIVWIGMPSSFGMAVFGAGVLCVAGALTYALFDRRFEEVKDKAALEQVAALAGTDRLVASYFDRARALGRPVVLAGELAMLIEYSERKRAKGIETAIFGEGRHEGQ